MRRKRPSERGLSLATVTNKSVADGTCFRIDEHRGWRLDGHGPSPATANDGCEAAVGGSEMFDQRIDSTIGVMVHRAIAMAVSEGLDMDGVEVLLRRWWHDHPVGGTTAWQCRTRAQGAVAVYLRHLRPSGWDLMGAEMRVGASVTDLAYSRSCDGELRDVFIDEVKTGRDPLRSDRVVEQVRRQWRDGHERWPGIFRGVRVATTRCWTRSAFWEPDGATLRMADGPAIEIGAGDER